MLFPTVVMGTNCIVARLICPVSGLCHESPELAHRHLVHSQVERRGDLHAVRQLVLAASRFRRGRSHDEFARRNQRQLHPEAVGHEPLLQGKGRQIRRRQLFSCPVVSRPGRVHAQLVRGVHQPAPACKAQNQDQRQHGHAQDQPPERVEPSHQHVPQTVCAHDGVSSR